MIELINFETGRKFGLKVDLIQLVTDDGEAGVFVWTNFEGKIGFKVTNSVANILSKIKFLG